jgi:WD40 repeat protein
MSLDDRRIASGVEDGAIIWDVDSKQMVFEPLVKHISSMCLSPDGKRLASWLYDRRVIIWDAETGAALSILVILAHGDTKHIVLYYVFCTAFGLEFASI